MPFPIPLVGDMPLQKQELEICHSNFLVPLYLPFSPLEERYSGEEWVFSILDQQTDEKRAKLLFIWWRAWHHRNNRLFGDGKASISDLASFLQNYYNTTAQIQSGLKEPDRKGKSKIDVQTPINNPEVKATPIAAWTKPDQGWLKLNTDASFVPETMAASWGAIIRDCEGKIVCAAWGPVHRSSNAEEAEAVAAAEGLNLAAKLYAPIVFESDCLIVTQALTRGDRDRSQSSFALDEAIQAAKKISNICICKISRAANRAAHQLAAFSRANLNAGLMYHDAPACVLELVLRDCNQTVIT